MKKQALRVLLPTVLAALGILASGAMNARTKVRIGVVLPKAQLGQGSSGVDVSEPLRTTLISYLSGPATSIVPLKARIPIQYSAEAEDAKIPYVLATSIVHSSSRRGGRLGKFWQTAAPFASVLPGVGATGSTGAVIASQAASSAAMAAQQQSQDDAYQAIASASQSSVRKGDELKLEYTLSRSGQPGPTKFLMRKATMDGEDLLSPLLEQVATDVLTAITQ